MKVDGAAQWQAEKPGRARRKWHKLQLGVAAALTDPDLSDESQVGQLLEQIESLIEQVILGSAQAWLRPVPPMTGRS